VQLEPVGEDRTMEVRPFKQVSYRQIATTMLREYPARSALGFTLMVTQSFLYNAIFFSYALVLGKFFHIADSSIPLFFLPFALRLRRGVQRVPDGERDLPAGAARAGHLVLLRHLPS
jgi:hypothetical protein